MDQPFAFSVPTAIRFGDGVSAALVNTLPPEAKHVAVLRGGRGIAAAPVIAALTARNITVTEVACAGEPSVPSVNAAVAGLAGTAVDAVVACGGGSVIDSGKAVAFCLSAGIELTEDFAAVPAELLNAPGRIPVVAIPTTAGTGAEVTANAVLDLPSKRAKVSLRGRALIPSVALVDPLLLPSAPRDTVLSSGLDAVVQTIEAYTSAAATPFSDAMTRPNLDRGLRALWDVLETGHRDAWRDLAWVSLSSGIALANSGLGAAHGAASVLGARYGAPHGALCGRLLIPVLRQNMQVIPQNAPAQRRLADCASRIATAFPPLPGKDALSGFEAWQDSQGLQRLAAFGVSDADLPELAVQSSTASSSQKNPVLLAPQHFEEVLRVAL